MTAGIQIDTNSFFMVLKVKIGLKGLKGLGDTLFVAFQFQPKTGEKNYTEMTFSIMDQILVLVKETNKKNCTKTADRVPQRTDTALKQK